jgi:undecaprenyl-diphosphatase
MLIVFGILLGLADRYGRKVKTFDQLNIRDGLAFGFGQALALIPGVSRSGATITTGLALGYDRVTATRYAFLLAIPAVLGSGLYEARKIGDDSYIAWGPTILATVVAFFVGLSVIAWLLRWLTTRTYTPFVIYRIAVGSMVLVLLSMGVLVG